MMKKRSGDFEDSFSSVPRTSGLCLMLAIATQHNMCTDLVDINQILRPPEVIPTYREVRYPCAPASGTVPLAGAQG